MTNITGWKFAVAATLLMAVGTLGLAFQSHRAVTSDIAAAREVRMFEAVTKPPLAQLQMKLLKTPLQPDLLHGLVAHRVSQRGAKRFSTAERQALESLGWQSTVVQMDLIQDGVARGDEAVVLTRIDGLLRRGKQMQPLIELVVQIEQTGDDARGKLVKMLSAKPNWRRNFLIAPVGMAGNKAVLARAETLDGMFASQLAPLREEVAPIVNTLEAMGESQRAGALWRKFHTIGRAAPVPFDPVFVGLAANPLDGQYQTMVYEWRAGQGAGFSVRASSIGDSSAVLGIRWDGRGAPVLLQQRLLTGPGRFAIKVKGSLLDRSALQRVAFVFYCSAAPPVFHDRLSQGPNGEFIFAANEVVSCPNPELRLVGMSEDSMSPLEMEFTSIRITRFARNTNLR